MGIGKFLVGGLCAIGAVIAAPVVLPVAAAAGAVAAGAAATAGTVALGAAATAGTAALGAATAAGAFVGSSAVGVAIGGTMATVGTGIGATASAVGLTSVATVAGTAAGATAIGTIATTGAVGLVSSASGVIKLVEAKDIVEDAEYRYNLKKKKLDRVQELTNKELAELGNTKVKVWNSFKEFIEVVSKIKNCSLIGESSKDESFNISKEELDQLENIAVSVNNLIVTGAGSVGVGVATSLAAYGGTMALATASTGTAISTLSGVAATNATLASFGGGSLAAGGLGMAGGTAVLGTLIAAPALAVGGLLLASKGSSNLEKAKETKNQADQAINKFNSSIELINEISVLTGQLHAELIDLFRHYQFLMIRVETVLKNKVDFNLFTNSEIKDTELLFISVKILKALTTKDLLVKVNNEYVANKDTVLNEIEISKSARN